MLLPRVLTAVVGIPLLLFLTHRGGLSFDLLVVAIAVLCLYEYGVLLLLGQKPVQRLVVALAGVALAVGQALGGPVGPLLAAATTVILLRELAARQHSLERAALTLLGALLLGWMPAHLALIRNLRPYGERLTFMLFLAVWACDTAAYFAGSMVGRHKLAPAISPRKTWEGFIAGCIGATGVVLGFRAAEPTIMSVPRAVGVACAIGLLGQVSDLTESMIKRAVGAKDSGVLLPGHGGIMDRFDSYLLAAPAVYYCLVL